jgi:hypothetical protein
VPARNFTRYSACKGEDRELASKQPISLDRGDIRCVTVVVLGTSHAQQEPRGTWSYAPVDITGCSRRPAMSEAAFGRPGTQPYPNRLSIRAAPETAHLQLLPGRRKLFGVGAGFDLKNAPTFASRRLPHYALGVNSLLTVDGLRRRRIIISVARRSAFNARSWCRSQHPSAFACCEISNRCVISITDCFGEVLYLAVCIRIAGCDVGEAEHLMERSLISGRQRGNPEGT